MKDEISNGPMESSSDSDHELLSIANMVKVEMDDSNTSPSETKSPAYLTDAVKPDTHTDELDVTDIVISEVGKHPPLYDRLLPLASRTISIRNQSWEAVRANVPGNLNVNDVKNMWNTVRHRFMHERRLSEQGTKYTTKYKYYHKMASILEPILEPIPEPAQNTRKSMKIKNKYLYCQRGAAPYRLEDLMVPLKMRTTKKHTPDTTSSAHFHPPTSSTSNRHTNHLDVQVGVATTPIRLKGTDSATASFFLDRLSALKPIYARKMERKILKNLHKYEALQEQDELNDERE